MRMNSGTALRQTNPPGIAHEIARILMKVAVSINSTHPFVYASGITSPIYTDNRLLISYPVERKQIIDAFVQRISESIEVNSLDVIAGTATAGIPWAAWIAERLDKPMIYVRSGRKEHGKTQQIEGRLRRGERVVVIEDHITTGKSSLEAVDAIRQAGALAEQCFAIFTYEFEEARSSFERMGVEFVPLTTISRLLEVAMEEHHISLNDQRAVLEWLAPHRGV